MKLNIKQSVLQLINAYTNKLINGSKIEVYLVTSLLLFNGILSDGCMTLDLFPCSGNGNDEGNDKVVLPFK